MDDIINVTRSSLPPFDEFVKEIEGLWESCWLTNMGIKHQALLAELKEYLEATHLVLFSNGHLALEAAIQCFDFPAGSEIITTPFTFVSTTQAIVHSGYKPVFADIDPITMTLDPAKAESLITDKTVAILPVHVYGAIADIQGFDRLKEQYGLKIIYDAAHAFGESVDGQSISKFGDICMYSFHATKIFNTIEGGAVICHNKALHERLSAFRNFGIITTTDIPYLGTNAKMNEIQAAMGLCNLRHLSEYIDSRRKAVQFYDELLDDEPEIQFPIRNEHVEYNGSYYPIFFTKGYDAREKAYRILRIHNIMARRYFYPLTSQLGFVRKQFVPEETPIARNLADSVLCLPLYGGIEEKQQRKVVDVLKTSFL